MVLAVYSLVAVAALPVIETPRVVLQAVGVPTFRYIGRVAEPFVAVPIFKTIPVQLALSTIVFHDFVFKVESVLFLQYKLPEYVEQNCIYLVLPLPALNYTRCPEAPVYFTFQLPHRLLLVANSVVVGTELAID